MLRKLVVPALAAALVLAACDQAPTGPEATDTDDYALVMFGEAGSSLEGTMGTAATGRRPFDGRTGRPQLPPDLALSQEQIDAIVALRTEFRAAHAGQIDSMKTIFQAARAAREAGATRLEVREILMGARAIAMTLRPDVMALHQAVWAVFTDAQKEWIRAHRPRRFPAPIAGP